MVFQNIDAGINILEYSPLHNVVESGHIERIMYIAYRRPSEHPPKIPITARHLMP